MDYQSIRNELEREGMVLYPFPKSILQMMTNEIETYFKQYSLQKSANELATLQESIFKMEDDKFVTEFSKPNRNFREQVGNAVSSWAREEFSKLFEGKHAGINCLCEWEVEGLDYPYKDSLSVYWRCVRPNKASDVGAPHRDSTFWTLPNMEDYDPRLPFEYKRRWKVWLPIFGCNKNNSLNLVPNSHKDEVPIKTKMTQFGERPTIDQSWLNANDENFISPLDETMGQCIIFHDDMVHKGVLNTSKNLRVSAEFSVLTD